MQNNVKNWKDLQNILISAESSSILKTTTNVTAVSWQQSCDNFAERFPHRLEISQPLMIVTLAVGRTRNSTTGAALLLTPDPRMGSESYDLRIRRSVQIRKVEESARVERWLIGATSNRWNRLLDWMNCDWSKTREQFKCTAWTPRCVRVLWST